MELVICTIPYRLLSPSRKIMVLEKYSNIFDENTIKIIQCVCNDEIARLQSLGLKDLDNDLTSPTPINMKEFLTRTGNTLNGKQLYSERIWNLVKSEILNIRVDISSRHKSKFDYEMAPCNDSFKQGAFYSAIGKELESLEDTESIFDQWLNDTRENLFNDTLSIYNENTSKESLHLYFEDNDNIVFDRDLNMYDINKCDTLKDILRRTK